MSENEYKELVYSLIDQLAIDGFNITRDNIGKFEFISGNDSCGYTLFMTPTSYILAINKKLLNSDKLNFLKCTIYHELAHIIQHNEAVKNNIIKYNQADDIIEIICDNVYFADNLVFDNGRHTKFWFDIIKNLNTRYNIVPKITAYLSTEELERFLEEFFMNEKTRPNTPHIDYTISGLTIDDMMKYNVKSEYKDTKINEDYVPQHEYRDLSKYIK